MTATLHHKNPDDLARYAIWRAEVRACLDGEITRSGLPKPIQDAIRYGSTEPKASRWRALLAMETGRALGTNSKASLHAAAGVEALHCATLSIDDLPSMDNAADRRGAPSMHRRFNEAMAIQASLWLLGASRTLMIHAASVDGIAVDAAAGLCALQQRTENELQLGQFMDLMGSLGKTDVDAERIARWKCGRMFALAAQAPAWLLRHGKKNDAFVAALDTFGEEVGLAYQIRDDLEDSGEDDSALNWSPDGSPGRPTTVVKHGRAEAERRVDACLANAIAALGPLGESGIDCTKIQRIAATMLGRA